MEPAAAAAVIFPVIFLILIIILCIVMIRNTTKAAKARKKKLVDLKDKGVSIFALFRHVNGLPLAEDVFCEIHSYPDRYEVISRAMQFSLSKDKVRDVCMKTETEIREQYVSSVGGAVGGAMLFGALGAMIGGRVKKKTDRTLHTYLIITYISEEEIKYIGFDATADWGTVNKLVKEFRERNTESTRIEL